MANRSDGGVVARAAVGDKPTASALFPVAVLTLIWGCNWPVLKMGVSEIPPLTFRAITLLFAALGMLLVSRLSGDSIRVPRTLWGKVATLAFFNIAGWMIGMTLLLGEDVRHLQRTPAAALLILGAAIMWAFGTVLLRKWKLPLPRTRCRAG